jgi:hypothetical protein
VPVAANVRRVEPSAQVAAGGALQAVSVCGYEQVPPVQVPGAVYVRRVEPSAQVAAGGVPHVTAAHGSALQAPASQPNGQVVSVFAYEHAPAAQVPVAAYVRCVKGSAQLGDGGALQVTVAHGSVAHAPALQPELHEIVWLVYEQAPSAQDPVGSYVFSSVALLHVAVGGVVHATPAHGSGLQAPASQPNVQVVAWLGYVQVPSLQAPIASYFVSSFAPVHFAVGGDSQVIPRHASASGEASTAPSPASPSPLLASPCARGCSSSSPNTALQPAPTAPIAPIAHAPRSHVERRRIVRTSHRSSTSPRRRSRW